jgi:magnesium transporter
MRRELQAGALLGLILGIIGILRVGFWAMADEHYFHHQPYGEHWPLVALTVGIALVGVVLWGTLSGSMLPFLLRRVGADPATSSAPFVATLVDVTGLIIYFSIALLIMRGSML